MKTTSNDSDFSHYRIALWLFIMGLLLSHLSCNLTNQIDPKVRKDLYTNYDEQFRNLLSSANQQMNSHILQCETIGPDLLPRKVTITGTHHELGHLIGLISKEYFGSAMKAEITRKPENDKINGQIITMYRSIYPQYIELVSGVAEAYDLSLESIDLQYMEHNFFTLLWWRLLQYEKFEELTDYYSPKNNIFDFSKCSIVSSYFEEQQTQFIGRNFDVSSDRPHFVVTANLDNTYMTLGNTCYMLYHWIQDGINEKGLFAGIATNGNPSKYNQKEKSYPDKPAVQVIHMVRIVLDSCASVDEALALIGSVRIWFPVEVNHLLIADSKGDAAVVEFDTERNMVTFRREHPWLVLTNTAYQEGTNYLKNNCVRYRKGVNMCKSGIRNMDVMLTVMKAIQIKAGNSRTLWTSITDISKKKMDVRFRSENYKVQHVFELNK